MEILCGNTSKDENQFYLNKAHDLEGQLIKENLEKIKLKEDNKAITEALSELRVKYQEVFLIYFCLNNIEN